MHYRLFVSSSAAAFSYQVDVQTLTAFAGKTVSYGLEWATTVQPLVAQTTPALILECPSLRATNTWASWSKAPAGVLALLPARDTLEYGEALDTPYLQSSALCGVFRGDELNRLGSLDFRLLKADGTPFTGSVSPFSFSLVFWSLEPEIQIEPYEFWHFWVHSGDRRSGTLDDAEFDLLLPDLAMYEDPGAWNAGISWLSDPGVAAAIVIPQFRSVFADKPVIAFTDGARKTLKPVTSDTLGLPVELPLDRAGTLRVQLRDPITLGPLFDSGFVDPWTMCVTLYKAK